MKNINYFNKNYPIEKDRYWAISDFLMESLEKNIKIPGKDKIELLLFLQQYTIQITQMDPFDISKEKLSNLFQDDSDYSVNE